MSRCFSSYYSLDLPTCCVFESFPFFLPTLAPSSTSSIFPEENLCPDRDEIQGTAGPCSENLTASLPLFLSRRVHEPNRQLDPVVSSSTRNETASQGGLSLFARISPEKRVPRVASCRSGIRGVARGGCHLLTVACSWQAAQQRCLDAIHRGAGEKELWHRRESSE